MTGTVNDLVFETYGDLSAYIRAHGPLPADRRAVVGPRMVLPHACTGAGECRHPGVSS